ncbi:divalent-cation tolerance protein CutA [Polynucleobacter sp. AP-Titi-500A-B4]|uniref:divalent-cation tolerance protein CutA n=1 Tax=Polynucleobacter sp. AP-Titi-500A-B4 TaxID=2576923 RepID=UPI001BFD3E2C|nr:divalent-cation tolerance protein CutA [Polynucleobacter sp. AP-Titi-500A-B4]QWE12588.1 divalent-cation tolerance protein CutA [Polynucleobacter sp. AP-Titi-500A-B4]
MPQNIPAKSHDLLVVVTSLPNIEAARTLAKALVENHLAACVQMSEGVYSIYRWEGRVCEEHEILLSAKTVAHQWEAISAFIKESHPYDLPEILAFSPEQYSQQYGEWVQAEVNSQ